MFTNDSRSLFASMSVIAGLLSLEDKLLIVPINRIGFSLQAYIQLMKEIVNVYRFLHNDG